ncbi:DFP1 [Sarcoptes scabiei]|nr:DFP1 [Sarcoptes scabiei]
MYSKIESIFVVCLIGFITVQASDYGIGSGHYGGGGQIDAAVMSKQDIRTIPMMSQRSGGGSTPVIDINSSPGSITLRFNSASTQINAIQKHMTRQGTVQKANVMAEPDLLIQNVQKPVIQKVREVITPFRKVLQEVRPVQEQVETVIARGMENGGSGGSGSSGSMSKPYGSVGSVGSAETY